jgi:S1-C subfamily serine protease
MLRALIAVIFLGLWPVSMLAQDVAYVQVEAHPTLTTAQARARFYAGQLENVNGFSLGGGWYGVVLGPYTPNDANTVLRQMRRDRTIPSDSFIITGRRFQQQFWPVGVGAQTTAQPLPDATTPEVETVAPIEGAPLAEVSAPVVIPTETRRQAQASEKLLDRDQRKNLQTALKWAGFYASAIDGAYGRGTRASMREWQNANNAEPTGVLTTTQRATLLASYNAVLDGMGLTLVRDYASGIEMLVPTGVVAFSEYEPPFVRFDPKGNLDASVLFISQDGDQNRLFGLYEILQTLTIVPNDGPRKRDNRSFELEGIDDDIHSYTYAKLDNGTIKGFSLIWPAGDDERRRRVLDEMKASFVVLDGVLDPSLAAPSENQGIDQVGGLAVRKPKMSRTGFFINDAGTVLTTAEAVGSCDRISLNSEHDAQVVHLDDALGLAVLRPDVALSPLGVVTFQTGIPRLQTSVAVAGFPYGGVLVTPSLTFGRLADMRGLNGEETIKRLALTAQSGDAGGPVFDNAGSVLGMLLPSNESGGRVLPQDVSFSVDSDEILASLNTAGIAAQTTDAVAFMSPETLTLRAADNTVLVSCW